MESFPWNSLLDTLKIETAQFLPCKKRARVSAVCKSLHSACLTATVGFPFAAHACLSVADSEMVLLFLEVIRIVVYDLGHARSISSRAEHVLAMYRSIECMNDFGLQRDVLALDANAFNHWHMGVYDAVKQIADQYPGQNLLAQVERWPLSHVQDKAYALLDRQDGTIVVSADLKAVYLVQSANGPICAGLEARGHPLPCPVYLLLLPFRQRVVSDNTVLVLPQEVCPNLRRQLFRAYAQAVDSGTLITSLPLQPIPPPPLPGPWPCPAPPLLPHQQRLLQRVKGESKVPGLSWLLRRRGYTEQSNPLHALYFKTSEGEVFNGIRTAALTPTPLEFFDVLCEGLFGSAEDGVGEDHCLMPCPATILVDEWDCMAPLQALLDPLGIRVSYYSPFSAQEDFCYVSDRRCGACDLPEWRVVEEGGNKLMFCARCRAVQYCSRDCQKAHWKAHKKDCVPDKWAPANHLM